jgi:hypothetical protein
MTALSQHRHLRGLQACATSMAFWIVLTFRLLGYSKPMHSWHWRWFKSAKVSGRQSGAPHGDFKAHGQGY